MQQYWINENGVQKGPFTMEELKSMTLGEEVYVWFSGMSNWKKIGEVEELRELITCESPKEEVPPELPAGEEASATIAHVETREPSSSQEMEKPVPPVYVENEPVAPLQPPHDVGLYSAMPQLALKEKQQCPPSNLVWSIICTILCFTPLGIVAIVFSALVKSNFNAGNYQNASKYSNWSAWLCIASIVLGLVMLPLAALSILFS